VATEALVEMKGLGATIVDPVDFHGAIAEVMAAYEPSFLHRLSPRPFPQERNPLTAWCRLRATRNPFQATPAEWSRQLKFGCVGRSRQLKGS
jgi:hypothetical protein